MDGKRETKKDRQMRVKELEYVKQVNSKTKQIK